MRSSTLGAQFESTRDVLHRVATHVLARKQDGGGVSGGLRVTAGGFGTVELGADRQRLRVADGLLLRESADASGTASRAIALDGATLTELADFAGLELSDEFSVGPSTPSLGDVGTPICIDRASAVLLGEWYGIVARALDQVVASVSSMSWATPSLAQLWPEHFDLALDVATGPAAPAERRVNLGGSPGDGFHAAPYLYVGPWTAERPGEPGFWNAPFGAILGYDDVVAAAEPVEASIRFLRTGLELLAA